MNEVNWKKILEDKFGRLGEVVKENIKDPSFPEIFHHQFIAALVMRLDPNLPVIPNHVVKDLLEETVLEEDKRQEELLRGAMGFILTKYESEILTELLDTQDKELLKSYGDIKLFMEDIWLTELQTKLQNEGQNNTIKN